MSNNRRAFIKKSIAFTGCTLVFGNGVFESPPTYAQGALEKTLSDLTAGKKIIPSDSITIKIPKIAENGALVPITVETKLEKTLSIAIVVEKNPIPLAVLFKMSDELDPFVSARLKMATSSGVIVLVETNDTVYRSQEYVNVTIGGCGD